MTEQKEDRRERRKHRLGGRAGRVSTARTVVPVVLRSVGTAAALLLAYIFMPLALFDEGPTLFFVLGGVLFLGSLIWQLRAITVAKQPELQAVEALALLFPLAILMFAGVYVMLSATSPGAFAAPMDKIDSIYFSVTVLTTVGFGDIVPVSSFARIAVTAQMLSNLVLMAFVLRAITAAIAVNKRTHASSHGA